MGLAGKRYAIVIDEAHTSQGSDTAIAINKAFGGKATPQEEDEDEATYLTRVRGKQPTSGSTSPDASAAGPRRWW